MTKPSSNGDLRRREIHGIPPSGFRGPLLLTGATSQTGECVVRLLLERGEKVRILTRDPEKAARMGFAPPAVEVRHGDLTAPWTLWDALEGCRALVHIAHIRYAATCVRACEMLGVRRLIATSSTRRFTRWPCETSRAVLRGEAAVTRSGLDWTILRSTMIYGPHDRNIGRLVAWMRRHRWMPLVDGGRSLLQPIHVEDLAAMVVRVLDEERSFQRAFTLAGPVALSYRQTLELIARALDRRVRFVPVPGGLAVAMARVVERLLPRGGLQAEQVRRLIEDKSYDISDACNILGFAPRAFEQGLRDKLSCGTTTQSLSSGGLLR